jgi:hypothetical protein
MEKFRERIIVRREIKVVNTENQIAFENCNLFKYLYVLV